MKSIILDYLQYRLPANRNFLEYVSGEMHTNLIILCQTLFPNSDTNAYVLTGCEHIITASGGGIGKDRHTITEGVIFYKNILSTVSEFSFDGVLSQAILISKSVIINEEYKSGNTLPAYREELLEWNIFQSPTAGVGYNSLIMADYYGKDINLGFSTEYTKFEASLIASGFCQTLILRVRLNNNAMSSNTRVVFPTGYAKQGFIGYGKVVNHYNKQAVDVCVYQIGESTVITRITNNPPISSSGAVTFQELSNDVNFTGNDIVGNYNGVVIYVNITNMRA